MVRLFIDAGRKSGVRPGDTVGAIAKKAYQPDFKNKGKRISRKPRRKNPTPANTYQA